VGAAVASRKVGPSGVGPQIFNWEKLDGLIPTQIDENTWAGKILSVDRFGNLITNFQQNTFSAILTANFAIDLSGYSIARFGKTFGEISPGEVFAYSGSSGFIEIAMNRESAAVRIRTAAGAEVTLRRTAAEGSGKPGRGKKRYN
jgi:S-adenosylmethionine hydrolase